METGLGYPAWVILSEHQATRADCIQLVLDDLNGPAFSLPDIHLFLLLLHHLLQFKSGCGGIKMQDCPSFSAAPIFVTFL